VTDRLKDRIDGARKAAEGLDAEAFLVTKLQNVHYLTGFTGSSGYVLVTPDRAVFITDFRYKTQSAEEVQGLDIVIQKGRWTEDVAALVRDAGVKRLCFEGGAVSFEAHQSMCKAIDGVELVPAKDAVEKLRLVKDEDELRRITEAIRRAERGFTENLSRVSPDMTEAETALGLEFNIRDNGAKRVPFDIIVASGPRAALPHGIASGRKMKNGDTVVIDFGGEADGYQSDITRSGVLGEPDRKQREIYDIVYEAQSRAIEAVKPGALCRDIDLAARGYIASKGYGDYFGHSLGHGVGLDVHEGPTVSPMCEDTAQPGMVFTIEPGIYIPDWGGFRIEDMVLVTDDGCRVLTSLPKDINFEG